MVAGSSQQSVHAAHAGVRVGCSQAQPLNSDLTDVDTEAVRRNNLPTATHLETGRERGLGSRHSGPGPSPTMSGPGGLAAVPIMSGPREMHQGPLTP